MAPSRFKVALFFVVASSVGAAAAVGCADVDPNYGKPDAIKGRTVVFPGSDDTTPTPGTDGGTTPTNMTPAQLFSVLYKGGGGAPGISSTCAGATCHSPGGGGVTLFVAADEASSYAIFKEKGYKDTEIPAPKGFFKKGQHSGPPLTAAQMTNGKAWAAAETAAGGSTTPPADAGAD